MRLLFNFWLLPLMGMFFAAGATGMPGAGEGGALPAGDSGGSDSFEYGTETTETDTAQAGTEQQADDTTQQVDNKEEPEVQEFRGSVSSRLRGLVKSSPALAQAFKENPKLQEQIEATFRREAALREVFPTVAEARQMREHFPNGLADVQAFQAEIAEVEQLDNDFYTKNQQGEYPGHARIVENMFRDDSSAAVALFRSIPRQWAKLHPDSYNDVMGKIVGATIQASPVFSNLDRAMQSKDPKRVEECLEDLFTWANGFLTDKKQTNADPKLASEREQFAREKADREREDGQRFNNSFVSQSRKLQIDTIKSHPAVIKLLANKSITEAKKNSIIEEIRSNTEKFLGKSRSFMGKLKPAYQSRNLQETLTLQKAAWSQQWLMNTQVRAVFRKEIPQLVQSNRESVKRRAGAPQTAKPAQSSEQKKPTAPYQVGGQWYKPDGSKFSTMEVLAGKHMA